MTEIGSISELRTVLLDAFEKYDKIGIVTHKNPDGDGLCASIALREILLFLNKKTDIILENEAPDSFDLLRSKEKTIVYNEDLSYPLILVLDCHDRERLGSCAPLLDKGELIIAIDHHENNNSDGHNSPENRREADLIYNEPHTVSAGAILFETLKKDIEILPEDLQREIAVALYITIINDTNNFTNKNTDSEVFRISSELCRMNIEPHEISKTFLHSKPASYFRFIGETLSTIQTVEDGKILFFHSTKKMLEDNNLDSDATSKITSWVKKPIGVMAVVYFRELSSGSYRLSLRSESVDVNKIANKYGGGGHRNAAGCEIEGSLTDIQSSILEDIRHQL